MFQYVSMFLKKTHVRIGRIGQNLWFGSGPLDGLEWIRGRGPVVKLARDFVHHSHVNSSSPSAPVDGFVPERERERASRVALAQEECALRCLTTWDCKSFDFRARLECFWRALLSDASSKVPWKTRGIRFRAIEPWCSCHFTMIGFTNSQGHGCEIGRPEVLTGKTATSVQNTETNYAATLPPSNRRN